MEHTTRHLTAKVFTAILILFIASVFTFQFATPAFATSSNSLNNTITQRSTEALIPQSTLTSTASINQPTNSLSDNTQTQPIYRMYNNVTSEHLFTYDKGEYDILSQETQNGGAGWVGENVAWYSPTTSTIGVYRLYNPALGGMSKMSHHYTTNKQEAEELVSTQGWQYDNGGEPIFYSAQDSSGNALNNA